MAGLRVPRASVEISRVVRIAADRFLRSWGSLEQPRRLRGAQESRREAPGAPGTPQEQPRNEQREFQENRVFRPWEASGGPRGTQNRWGGLAGAKGKPRLSLALGPPLVRVFRLFPSAPPRVCSYCTFFFSESDQKSEEWVVYHGGIGVRLLLMALFISVGAGCFLRWFDGP